MAAHISPLVKLGSLCSKKKSFQLKNGRFIKRSGGGPYWASHCRLLQYPPICTTEISPVTALSAFPSGKQHWQPELKDFTGVILFCETWNFKYISNYALLRHSIHPTHWRNLLRQSKSTSLLMVWRANCFQIKFGSILGELLHLLAQHLAEVLVSFAEVLDDAVLEERM